MPACKAVDHDYLNSAPVVVVNTVDINATPAEIFASFENEDDWPKWFDGMNKVEWTSPKPYGVGTTRTVTLGPLKVYEYFTRWETDVRFTFYFTKTNIPFVKALMEDYLLEPVSENVTRFTYTVAYEPAFPLSLTGPIGKALLKRNFTKAANSLVEFMSR